jgi:hypothetical protein
MVLPMKSCGVLRFLSAAENSRRRQTFSRQGQKRTPIDIYAEIVGSGSDGLRDSCGTVALPEFDINILLLEEAFVAAVDPDTILSGGDKTITQAHTIPCQCMAGGRDADCK